MTLCGNCGKHEGSWCNNRNNIWYCSKCVGAIEFLQLKTKIETKIKELDGEIAYCKRKVYDYEDIEKFKQDLEEFIK